MAALEPQQFGEFAILGKLGQGAMGAVYKARQTSLNRIVALKLLPAHYAGDPDFLARFKNEAMAAAALNHSNIVKVYAAGEDSGTHFFAMEYVEGESLGARLERKGRIEPKEAIAVACHIAQALDYAWKKAQVIHRDIKPDNIFLSREGTVKLGDLGLAKVLGNQGGSLTQTGAAMGTPYYVSPEQAMGRKEIDFRADIYSLGCTIYHAMTGLPPYQGESAMAVMLQHISQPAPKIQAVWPTCPPPLIGLLDRMLRKRPEERHESYEALLQQLYWVAERISQPSGSAAAAASLIVPMPGPRPGSTPDATRKSAPVAKATVAKPSPPASGSGKMLAIVGTIAAAAVALLVWQPWKTGRSSPAPARAVPDAPLTPAAESLLSATTDAPFVNSIGMKFVPVKIPGESDGGKTVLFCIWQTRVKDYTAVMLPLRADESWRNQEKDGIRVGREPDHPVCAVNWHDARAFCQQLTNVESASGLLPTGARYRLPTDLEWSFAAGLAKETGATPGERQKKGSEIYPWGSATYPPPTNNVGNFGDETYHAKFPDNPWIQGYSDGFATTSPVGSFPSNVNGLHDIGGNVWEWCEDLFAPADGARVLRGSPWQYVGERQRLLSRRYSLAPELRNSSFGFRCVIDIGSLAASAGTTERPRYTPAPVAAAATAGVDALPPESKIEARLGASKDQPFVNTLGMKFVPVPILGGPTGGRRLLFSVWDTRVQDYEAFVKDTKREWPKADFQQGPTHPAVNVSWDDAQVFCQWLTTREHAAGRLPAEWRYRLPGDHEWSCAVEIGAREDAAKPAADKSGQIADVFPWGDQWPPPKDAGNYAGEELRPELKAVELKYKKGVIAGYNDGFVNTSPVGSFAANRFGLYDTGGNVWKWCEDRFDQDQANHVLRGASWASYDRPYLLSSLRSHDAANARNTYGGFRCVLDFGVPIR